MTLDSYDKQILRVIQDNGKITNQDLADCVGLSPSACLRRVKTLEESGIISGYKCVLNAKLLGLGLTAIVYISMDKHIPERFNLFEQKLLRLPKLLSVC